VSAIRGLGLRGLIAVFVATLVLAACGREDARHKFQSTDITGVEWGQDFHLTDHTGKARSLADFRGKVVMMFFGYSHCPDMCPMTLAKMAQAVERLGDDGKRVQGLFVTVDPARDTPAVLGQYVPAFHPAFLGLYSNAETIAKAAKDFKVFYAAQPPNKYGFYTMDHNSGIFVFDAGGRLRLYVSADAAVGVVVHDLKVLLNE
jgi:protein SCO1/2